VSSWKTWGVILILFGIVTLGGSAMIYNYQMSQDGDIVYQNGNWYELPANPNVIALMTLGMVVGGIITLIGFLAYFNKDEEPIMHRVPLQYAPPSATPLPINYCPGCGRQTPPGALFCEGCGRKLN